MVHLIFNTVQSVSHNRQYPPPPHNSADYITISSRGFHEYSNNHKVWDVRIANNFAWSIREGATNKNNEEQAEFDFAPKLNWRVLEHEKNLGKKVFWFGVSKNEHPSTACDQTFFAQNPFLLENRDVCKKLELHMAQSKINSLFGFQN